MLSLAAMLDVMLNSQLGTNCERASEGCPLAGLLSAYSAMSHGACAIRHEMSNEILLFYMF